MKISLNGLIYSISKSMEFFIPEIKGHFIEVARISSKMAREKGLDKHRIYNLILASLLHDIGHFMINGPLSIFEKEMVGDDRHAIAGQLVLDEFEELEQMSSIIRYHHDPEKASDDIREESMILAKADKLSLEGTKVEMDTEDDVIDILLANPHYLDYDEAKRLINLFVHIMEFRSPFTAGHSKSVSLISRMIAERMQLDTDKINEIELAGLMHDIGKITIPLHILHKNGKLSEKEYDIMQKHVVMTSQILSDVDGFDCIEEMASMHHEYLDGTGYPQGLKGDEINIGARVVAISDIFVSLTEDRHYRAGFNKLDVIRKLEKLVEEGKIDSDIVAIIIANYDEFYSDHINHHEESLSEINKIKTKLG